MTWRRWIGFDDKYLKITGTPEERQRQIFVFSMLAIIIVCLSVISGLSTLIYMLVIFHNWIFGILIGIFIGMVVFNLNGLIVITAFSAYGTTMAEYFNDHYRYYKEHIMPDEDIHNVNDEWIDQKVFYARRQLEQLPVFDIPRRGMNFSEVLTMALRVSFLCLFAILFSTGIEIFLFRDQINQVLADLVNYYHNTRDTWMVENILSPGPNDEFVLVNSRSILLVIEILNSGLGVWKIFFDILFMFLFLTPLIIVFRSREFREGGYIRAHIFSCLSISFRHFLISKRFCQQMDRLFRSSDSLLSLGEDKKRGVL
jgi:hypothetical protein